MKIIQSIAIALIVAAATSCASWLPDLRTYNDPRDTPKYKKLLASGASIDFFGCPNMNFKPGYPKSAQNLMRSLDSFSVRNFQQYFNCLGIISRTPALAIEISGFADAAECTSDCYERSLRRAEAVRDALLQMHFPAEQIRCVAGHGSAYPLDTTEIASVVNRRVELWYEGKGCKV
jgi:hypothetical protein